MHWGFSIPASDSWLLDGKCVGYSFAIGPKSRQLRTVDFCRYKQSILSFVGTWNHYEAPITHLLLWNTALPQIPDAAGTLKMRALGANGYGFQAIHPSRPSRACLPSFGSEPSTLPGKAQDSHRIQIRGGLPGGERGQRVDGDVNRLNIPWGFGTQWHQHLSRRSNNVKQLCQCVHGKTLFAMKPLKDS